MDEMNNTARMMDPHDINMMWQKKKQTQEKIQEYKEHKLQMQIQQIELQQNQLRDKMEREKQAEKRRLDRDQKLKDKINEYALIKMQ